MVDFKWNFSLNQAYSPFKFKIIRLKYRLIQEKAVVHFLKHIYTQGRKEDLSEGVLVLFRNKS